MVNTRSLRVTDVMVACSGRRTSRGRAQPPRDRHPAMAYLSSAFWRDHFPRCGIPTEILQVRDLGEVTARNPRTIRHFCQVAAASHRGSPRRPPRSAPGRSPAVRSRQPVPAQHPVLLGAGTRLFPSRRALPGHLSRKSIIGLVREEQAGHFPEQQIRVGDIIHIWHSVALSRRAKSKCSVANNPP